MACLTDPETEAGRQVEAKDAERLMVARQLSRQDSFPCHRLSKVGDSTHSVMSATTTLSVYVSLILSCLIPLIEHHRKLNFFSWSLTKKLFLLLYENLAKVSGNHTSKNLIMINTDKFINRQPEDK